jgi:acyl-CoA thioester hydrolase
VRGRLEVAPLSDLRCVATARVLYADTDKMGIVYHASYLRYLELGRVELLRNAGFAYTEMEAVGLALPLTDLQVRYHAPALYDDRMSIHVGVALATRVRVAFHYRVTIEPGDRAGSTERIDVLSAETRHCCVRRADARPERIPSNVWSLLHDQLLPANEDRV